MIPNPTLAHEYRIGEGWIDTVFIEFVQDGMPVMLERLDDDDYALSTRRTLAQSDRYRWKSA